MPLRLIAVDVDGTLLDSRHQLPPRNAAALRSALSRGCEIALATGRRYNFVRPIAAALGCPCWVIASNGALVRRFEPGTVATVSAAYRHFLPRAKARAVLGALSEYQHQAVVTMPEGAAPSELYMEPERDPPAASRLAFATWLAGNRKDLAYVAPLERCLSADPVQLMFGGGVATVRTIGEALAAQPLARELTSLRTLYPHRDLGILDVLDAGVDKGVALRSLAEQLKIPAAGVLAIGDNYNDLGMLEFAGQAVLMGNAHPGMDRPGWRRTTDNDHAGVAAILEQLWGWPPP